MDERVRQALTWYDIAAEKYVKSLNELKTVRQKTVPSIYVSENQAISKYVDKVRKCEEKLSRASLTLCNITQVMVALDNLDDESKKIILGDDFDDEND